MINKCKRIMYAVIIFALVISSNPSYSRSAVKFRLSKSSIKVVKGNKLTVKCYAPGKIKAKSLNRKIAKVTVKKKNIIVKGIRPGITYVRVSCKKMTRKLKVVVKSDKRTPFIPFGDVSYRPADFTGDGFSSDMSTVAMLKPSEECCFPPKQTVAPTMQPTAAATAQPTAHPTVHPTRHPTGSPLEEATAQPTEYPTAQPTEYPAMQPTRYPTAQPTENL